MEKATDQTPVHPSNDKASTANPPPPSGPPTTNDTEANRILHALLTERLASIAQILPQAWNATPESSTDVKAVLAYAFDVVVSTPQIFDTGKLTKAYSDDFLVDITNFLNKLDGEDDGSEESGEQDGEDAGPSGSESAVRLTRELRRERLRQVIRDVGRPADVTGHAVPKSVEDLRADVKKLMRGPQG